MGKFSAWSLFLVVSVLAVKVLSQDDDLGFDLSDAIGEDATSKPESVKPKGLPAAGGEDLDLADFFDDLPPTKAPLPKDVPKTTKAPVKPKPKPAEEDFDLSDALDPNNDIGGKDKNKGQADKGTGGGGRGDGTPNNTGGSFSDSDLIDVGKDDTYKPDKGKGGSRPGQQDPADENDYNTMAETGTIAGIVSAVAMALVGAVSSYISYQKKKFCFSIQQSLNADMVKTDNPDAVVATEPQVQQTLLEPSNAEPPSEENVV